MGKRQSAVYLVDKVFSRLTVLKIYYKKAYGRKWPWAKCECICGVIVHVRVASLKKGVTKSCGCLIKARALKFVGQRFVRLIIKRIVFKKYIAWAKCRCDCGRIKLIRLYCLKNGTTISCGCYNVDCIRNRAPADGDSVDNKNHYLYELHQGIKKRCYNKKCKAYKYYGARGISLHTPWHRYTIFKKYILTTLGHRPSSKYSLDRYPDNDGNYEPGNIRWTTDKEQNNNSRNCKKFK